MKIGEIKIEAIKLMFTNYDFDMGIEDLSNMIHDENYGSYIVNMNGAILRALDRIENACVLPLKRMEIPFDLCIVSKHYLRFNTAHIKDLFLIDRITAEYKDGQYCGNVGFESEGEVIVLPKANVDYSILYYPEIKDVNCLDDDAELLIPDKLARLIPYFIKGDLYQEEEPDLAADARNIFEASLDDLKVQNQSKQNYIHQVYSM